MDSGAIAGVDVDVAFGQVAGPEAGGAFAFASNREADLALLGIEFLLQRGLGERRGQASAADGRFLQVDIDLGRIERDAGVSAAERMRPQLGSAPAMAVLTSGELAMARAIWAAARSSAAPLTSMVTSLLAPSPSRAICWRAIP